MFQPLPTRDLWYQLGLGVVAAGVGGILGLAITSVGSPLLVIAGVAGIIFALLTVTNVDFALLVLVFMVYTRFSDVLINTYNAPSVLQPYILLVLVSIVARWVFHRELSRDWLRATVLVAVYAVVIFFSLFYAADFSVALEAGIDFLKDGVITIILVILINSGPILRKTIWVLIFAGIFLGTISTYQGLTGSYDNTFWGFGRAGVQNIVGVTEGNRVSGPLGDPNYYAQLMLVLIPLAINRFVSEKQPLLKLLAGWAVAVCSLTVVYTFSRGAVVAVMLMGLFSFIQKPPRVVHLVIGTVLFAVLLASLPGNYVARVATIPDVFGGTNSVRGEVSFRGRASETIVAWLMFMDYPLFGVGVNNYPVFYQRYSRTLGLDPRVEQRQAHNLYLQIAAETGIAGILVYGLILWTMFSGMQRAWQRLKAAYYDEYSDMIFSVMTGIVGYLSAALFIHAAYPRYFWLLAGMALAIPQVAKKILNSRKIKR